MLFSIIYVIVRGLLRLVPTRAEDRDREVELLVLRHQVKVLSRKAGRPKLRRFDKVFLSAAARMLPRERRSSLLVTPDELLDWTLILGRRHLDRVLHRYASHYNSHRPHRGIGLVSSEARGADPPPSSGAEIHQREVLPGINEYLAA